MMVHYRKDENGNIILSEYMFNRIMKVMHNKENKIKELENKLKEVINNDVELGARYLRKIGYIDFDEDRKVYINKHNNEPFWQEDEREKGYYIPDEELDEYTKQLENQLQQKENIIKEAREYINWRLEEHQDMDKYQMEELLEILDKENRI